MIDREKVLRGLECCRNFSPPDVECPEECPYSIESNSYRCCTFTPLIDDTIALLQETVEPEHCFPDPKCPECGTEFVSDAYYIGKPMTKYYMYCPGCGRKIKWYV